jgi:hypothetical protein
MMIGPCCTFSLVFLCSQVTVLSVNAFQPTPSFHQRRATNLCSSVGGSDNLTPSEDSNDGIKNFLNAKEESENMNRARQYMSETSLPISFNDIEEELESKSDKAEESSAMVPRSNNPLLEGSPSPDILQKNPYLRVVSTLSPSDLISKFTATADPRVQNAVRATILGLIGSLPKMAFDTTTITTGQRLASLMFQLQMSGYMFKNAEYRLSLSQSLGMTNGAAASSNFLLTGSDEEDEDEAAEDLLKSKVKGKLKIRYGNATRNGEEGPGLEMEVDAAAYMAELRSEVSKLRDELKVTRQAKDEELRKDLLTYIRTLPEQELRSLTSTISKDVLVAMKGLVNVVMSGIAEEDGEIGPDTVTEQSAESMAQLCMWQLVVGYNLRELEVREEMKKSLEKRFKDIGTGVDFSEPGALE